ncbi:MAG: preprotein translocase subunit YajC [Rubripirellula sp.]
MFSTFVAIAFSTLSLLAQEEAAAAPASPFVSILRSPMTPLVGLFLLFYFIFILPERRRKSEEANMMSTLKKNDRVVTIGGIHATIVAASADSDVVTVRFDESTRVKMNRTAIAKIVTDATAGKNKETASGTKDK